MNITRKLALGLAGGALIVTGGLGAAAIANADTPSPAPAAQAQNQGQQGPRGFGGGMGAKAGNPNGPQDGTRAGVRAMNGSGYGAQDLAEYLAEKLGVPAADVTKALTAYHADAQPPAERGRDLSDADQAARHEALAASLAESLGKDAATVQAALDGYSDYRQAERTAQLKEALDARVKAGTITQAQADEFLKAHEPGSGPAADGMGMGLRMGPRR